MGSVMTTVSPTSANTVECPIQVARTLLLPGRSAGFYLSIFINHAPNLRYGCSMSVTDLVVMGPFKDICVYQYSQ